MKELESHIYSNRKYRTPLLPYRSSVFSQWGEDGVLRRLFEIVGIEHYTCCEFGAADGVWLSNTRQFLLDGWTGILIESDETRYRKLVQNYADRSEVHCIQAHMDAWEKTLRSVLKDYGLESLLEGMDLLSIDIDGLDYEIFEQLNSRPRVLVIEINALFPLDFKRTLPRSLAAKVGQPYHVFERIAKTKNYGLVSYTGNAIYVQKEIMQKVGLPEASFAEELLETLKLSNQESREYAFLANLGLVGPFNFKYKYNNPLLTHKNLGINNLRALELVREHSKRPLLTRARSRIMRMLKSNTLSVNDARQPSVR